MNKGGTLKKVSLWMIVMLLIINMSITAYGADFTDIEDHWAENEIDKWSGYGLVNGYEGKFNPNAPITRAELAVIINKIFDYQIASNNTFNDLGDAWYTDAILKNNAKGIMSGYDSKVRPMDYVTRQEAIIMLCKSFNIETLSGETKFSDDQSIPSWSKGFVKAMNEKGFVSGKPDGGFHPEEIITRAEVIKILDNIVGGYYYTSGEYTGEMNGLVVVNEKDVVFKNVTINGQLIVAEGVADGDFTLNDSIVNGEMFVYGGGENSIKIYNTQLKKVVLDKQDSKVRIVSDGNIGEIVVEEDALVILDGELSVEDITIGENSDVEIRKNVKANIVNIEGKNVKAVFDGKIETLKVQKEAEKTVIEGDGKVNTLHGEADKIKVDVITSPTGKNEDNSSGDSGSTGGNSNSNTSSNTGSDNSSNTGSTPPTVAYTYSVKESFVGSPTTEITVHQNNTPLKGYTLFVNQKEVGKDLDNDGKVITVKQLVQANSLVEYLAKDSSTKIRLSLK